MKLIIVISMLLTQVAFSQEIKLVPIKHKSQTGCIDINDETAILKLKSKQQLALLALRKEKLKLEQSISLSCYKKYDNVDLSTVSSKLNVNIIFNNDHEQKYTNDLHLNLDSSKDLNDFKVRFDLAECVSRKFNSKKIASKDMATLPPICSQITFANEKSLDLRKPASTPIQVPKVKMMKMKSVPTP